MQKKVDKMAKQLEGSSPKATSTPGAPQTRPRITRAQLKQNPKAVLDDGPETSDSGSGSPSSPAAGAHPATCKETKLVDAMDTSTPLVLPFKAQGMDEESFLASGHTSALPPQYGITGWQRFTMMKYFCPEEIENPEEYDQIEIADAAIHLGLEGLWAYEGVVLPGGNVVVGRWWSPASGDGLGIEKPAADNPEGVYCGPFLWWCVD